MPRSLIPLLLMPGVALLLPAAQWSLLMEEEKKGVAMGNPSFVPEAALQLFYVVLYCMAYILGGAALIAFSVYTVLVCSEMLSQPRSKRAKVLQPTRRVPVAEITLDPSAAETPSLPASVEPAKQPVWVNTPPRGAQIPMTFRGTLEGGSAEP